MKLEVYIYKNLGQADDGNTQPSSENSFLQVPIWLLDMMPGAKGDNIVAIFSTHPSLTAIGMKPYRMFRARHIVAIKSNERRPTFK